MALFVMCNFTVVTGLCRSLIKALRYRQRSSLIAAKKPERLTNDWILHSREFLHSCRFKFPFRQIHAAGMLRERRILYHRMEIWSHISMFGKVSSISFKLGISVSHLENLNAFSISKNHSLSFEKFQFTYIIQ